MTTKSKNKRSDLKVYLFFLGMFILGGCFLADPEYRVEVLNTCKDTTLYGERSVVKPLGNIVIVSYPPDHSSWSLLDPSKIGFNKAKTTNEINTIVCIEAGWTRFDDCLYEAGARLERHRRVWNVKVIDWETAQIRATNDLIGSIPEPCPEQISNSGAGISIEDNNHHI